MTSPAHGPVSGRLRAVAFATAMTAAFFAPAGTAQAQGRCSCNRGCHQYPGQCVQRRAEGCDPGFAPFCGTRSSSCPRAGWVSCDGECTCVRVSGYDAGTVDAGFPDSAAVDASVADVGPSPDDRPAVDVATGSDSGTSVDRPSSADGAVPADRPPTPSDTPAPDRPGADVVAASDRPASADGPTPDVAADLGVPSGDDASAPADGGPPVTDGGCECSGGVCVDGACITERCFYNQELGFTCTRAGTMCRLIEGEAYCVPLCADVICEAGKFCDERSGGRCVRDECSTTSCPAGTTCRRNQCEYPGADGGVAVHAATDAATDAATATGGMTAVDDGGCGCRAAGTTDARTAAWWGAGALLALVRRRRKPRA